MQQDKVQHIISIICKDDDSSNRMLRYFIENKVEAISISTSIASLFVAIVIGYIRNDSLWVTPFIVCFASLAVYSLSSFFNSLMFVAKSVATTLSQISKQYENDYKLALKISIFSESSINQTKLLLSQHVDFINNRIGFLIGVVDKVGIIPAVLALYLTYVKSISNIELDKVSSLVWGVLAGIYIGSFIGKHIIDSFKSKIVILNLALQIKKENSQFKLH